VPCRTLDAPKLILVAVDEDDPLPTQFRVSPNRLVERVVDHALRRVFDWPTPASTSVAVACPRSPSSAARARRPRSSAATARARKPRRPLPCASHSASRRSPAAFAFGSLVLPLPSCASHRADLRAASRCLCRPSSAPSGGLSPRLRAGDPDRRGRSLAPHEPRVPRPGASGRWHPSVSPSVPRPRRTTTSSSPQRPSGEARTSTSPSAVASWHRAARGVRRQALGTDSAPARPRRTRSRPFWIHVESLCARRHPLLARRPDVPVRSVGRSASASSRATSRGPGFAASARSHPTARSSPPGW